MSGKISLTEATMLALQGKLQLEESKEVKEECINVSVEDNTTIVETEDATVIVTEPEDVVETVEEVPTEVVEVPSEEVIEEVPVETVEEVEVEEIPSIDEIVDEEVIEESKEVKTEDVDPRPNETKLVDYLESVGSDWEQVAKNLLAYMSDDDIKRFSEIYEYSFEEETELDESIKTDVKEQEKVEENLDSENEDGWGEQIGDICEDFFYKTERVAYEVRNCRRGSYAGFGSTVEELSDAMSELAEMAENIAAELDSTSAKLEEDSEKFSSETFNKALTEFYKSKNDYVESVVLNKLSKNNTNLKIEATLTNKDGISKDICLEMKKVKSGTMFEKYTLAETKTLKTESNKVEKAISMMTYTNNDKVLECKYLK